MVEKILNVATDDCYVFIFLYGNINIWKIITEMGTGENIWIKEMAIH